MKKMFILLTGLLFTLTVQSQIPCYSHTRNDFSLKGNVKSVEQHCYDATFENGHCEKGKVTSGYDNDVHNLIYEFDPTGHLQHLKRLDLGGSIRLDVEYLYENGLLSKIIWDPQVNYVFSHDKEGRIAEKTQYIRGNVFDVTRYAYNKEGQVEKETPKKFKISSSFFYNDQGQLTKKVRKADRTVVFDYVYDSDGFLKQSIDGGDVRYEYTVVEKDEQGNWKKMMLKSVVYDAYFLLERSVEYYN